MSLPSCSDFMKTRQPHCSCYFLHLCLSYYSIILLIKSRGSYSMIPSQSWHYSWKPLLPVMTQAECRGWERADTTRGGPEAISEQRSRSASACFFQWCFSSAAALETCSKASSFSCPLLTCVHFFFLTTSQKPPAYLCLPYLPCLLLLLCLLNL